MSKRVFKDHLSLRNLFLEELPSFLNGLCVEGYLDIAHNKLTTLHNCPQQITSSFYCHNNKLVSLEGSPILKSVVHTCSFYCSNNMLTSLKGCPRRIDGDFQCNFNPLTSLDDCPEYVGGDFFLGNHSVDFTKEDVKKVCEVGGMIYDTSIIFP